VKEIFAVLGFFLLVGLLILRIIEEQRREARRANIGHAPALHPVEGRTTLHVTIEAPCSTRLVSGDSPKNHVRRSAPGTILLLVEPYPCSVNRVAAIA